MKNNANATARTKSDTEAPARRHAESCPSPGARDNGAAALQHTLGNQVVLRLLRSGVLQARLAVSRPDDIYEQEADRVADEVVRMPENTVGSRESGVGNSGIIQTKPG